MHKNLGDIKAIETIGGIDPAAIPEAILQSPTPIVLKQLVRDWPLVNAARQSDTAVVEHLLQCYHGAPVTLLTAPASARGRFTYNEVLDGFNFVRSSAILSDITGQLLQAQAQAQDQAQDNADALYVGSTTVDLCLPGLRDQNDLAINHLEPLVSIWLGGRSVIAAHFDFPANIACVVAGRRRFTLFPPEQVSNLYIGPLEWTPAGQPVSLVDMTKPDLTRFPKFRDALAKAQVAELNAGDALLIPSMWWHHVEALDAFNVLINYWWRDRSSTIDSPMTALLHATVAINALPAEQKAHWQALFEHFIFHSSSASIAHIPADKRGVLDPQDETAARRMRAYLFNAMKR